MKGLQLISKLFSVLFLANTFWCSSANFDFHRMANKSSIWIRKIGYYPGMILEAYENAAIFKSRVAEEAIKVLHPIQCDRKVFFENEIYMLRILRAKFSDPVDNGIVKLIVSANARWKHDDDLMDLRDEVLAIIYTYGEPLFPVLMQCFLNNDRKMLFFYFWQMARSMSSMDIEAGIIHNNIGPNVFRLTSDGKAFVDNFELARRIVHQKRIYKKNDFPIGFKPTMNKKAMNAEKRDRECQRYSFELTSYYILSYRLPWQMNAIEYLWNVNTEEALEITLELQKIDLAVYFKLLEMGNPIHSQILNVIRAHGANYASMSEQFLQMYHNDYTSL